MAIDINTYKNFEKNNKNIYVSDFKNRNDRTLIFGYTVEKYSFHVYLKNNMLHICIYNDQNKIIYYDTSEYFNVDHLSPSKRSYPESFDEEFLKIALDKTDIWSFNPTKYDNSRYERVKDVQFHGKIKD